MKKSCIFYAAFWSSLVIVGCAIILCTNNICKIFGGNKELYSLVHALYLIFAFFSVWVLLKFAKYISKLDILEGLVNSDKDKGKDKELIKKYCDTLVEL